MKKAPSPNSWGRTKPKPLSFTERASHESAATRRPGWPFNWVIKNVYRYPMGYPQWLDHGLPVAKISAPAHSVASPTEKGLRPMQGWGLLLTLAAVFAGGMALNLTPCVYPIIPVTISYFAGQSDKRQSRLVAHGLCYVLGLALTNSTLGVMAALTGGLMGAVLQNPAVLAAIAAVLLFFASSLFGFWEMRLPSRPDANGFAKLRGLFRKSIYGSDHGSGSRPLYRPFCLWVS